MFPGVDGMHSIAVVKERRRRQLAEQRIECLEKNSRQLVQHYDLRFIEIAKQVCTLLPYMEYHLLTQLMHPCMQLDLCIPRVHIWYIVRGSMTAPQVWGVG